MAQQLINVGTVANDGTGDKPRAAGIKINENFTELYARPTLYLGAYTSLVNLEAAHPTATSGQYAIVDPGPGTDAVKYLWDEDEGWVQGGGSGAGDFATLAGNATDNASLAAQLNLKADALISVVALGANPTLTGTQLALINAGDSVIFSGTGTVTIPLNSAVAFPIGSIAGFRGFDDVAITATGTLTGTSGNLLVPSGMTVYAEKTGTDTWILHNGAADAIGTATQTALNLKSDNLVYHVDKTASYTLLAADLAFINAGKVVHYLFDSASGTNLEIPPNADVAFPIGTVIFVTFINTGVTSFVAGSGVTLTNADGLVLSTRYKRAFAEKIDTNEWLLGGALTT